MPAALSPLADQVRRHDRDRFVTALFAPVERREALFALYAFNDEIARIRESVSEPLLGEMRLQWWRDAIELIYTGGERAHPVVRGLAGAVREHDLTRATFERLIDARAADLVNGPPDTLATLEAYAAGTASSLIELVLEALGARENAARKVAHHAGIGWALAGLLRAVPFHTRAGRVFLPKELLERHGIAAEDIAASKGTAGLAQIASAVAARAREHLVAARAGRGDVPRTARAALLTTSLAVTYLGRLEHTRYDVFDPGWSATRPPVARLTILAALGRY